MFIALDSIKGSHSFRSAMSGLESGVDFHCGSSSVSWRNIALLKECRPLEDSRAIHIPLLRSAAKPPKKCSKAYFPASAIRTTSPVITPRDITRVPVLDQS